MSEETLTDGLNTEIPSEEPVQETPEVEIPEGFDDVLYDTETQTLRMDKVKERFDADAKQIESYKKQAMDMRRKLSKGVEVPDSEDKYEYVTDAKYDKYMLNEDSVEHKHINETFKDINKFCMENGIPIEASKNLKSFMLGYMEKVHVLDTRSDEEIAKDNAENIREQRLFLGEDASEIIKDNTEFYRERGPFSREERIYLMNQISKSGVANSVYRKVRELLNTGTTYDIPATAENDTNADALRQEYFRADTSEQRREEIIKKSLTEGWKLV